LEEQLLLKTSDLASRNRIGNMMLFSAVHALVDASCAAVIFGYQARNNLDIQYFAFLVVLYNVLAFAFQPPLGYLMDTYKIPVQSAAAGCLLITASAFLKSPVLVICFAGFGNALFHAGGGVVILNISHGKASLPGIYVAPGALGLAIGVAAGRGGYIPLWPFAFIMVISAVCIGIIKHPVINYSTENNISYNKFGIIVVLLMFSIAVRSMVGMVLNFPWQNNVYLAYTFTSAVVLGKALGGILADRFGWIRITVPGLLISAPLLLFGASYPFLAIAGILLFNLTMPVTLAALSNMMPGRAGFAFGLTTFALIVGVFPTYLGIKDVLGSKIVLLCIVLCSIYTLYKGLKLYFAGSERSYNNSEDKMQINQGSN
jgi:hypothetical protein